jgi:hypothetical protein
MKRARILTLFRLTLQRFCAIGMSFKNLNIVLLSMLLSVPAFAGTPAQTAFKELSALVGDWEGVYSSGSPHRVSYKLTANGTVLVETWTMSPTRESMTIYALDGDRLLATHYCPQGNQPRLALVEKDGSGKYRFKFLDGTNLQDQNGSHQHAFWIKLDLPKLFSRSETYIKNSQTALSGEDEEEAVVYHRVSKPDLR